MNLWKFIQNRRFFLFAVAGVVAFFVDLFALIISREVLGLGLYAGRFISYLAAATCAWYINRTVTFKQVSSNDSIVMQWWKYLWANSVGGVLNYLVYALLVYSFGDHIIVYSLAVGAGSLSGLVVNYTLSKMFVFKNRSPNAE